MPKTTTRTLFLEPQNLLLDLARLAVAAVPLVAEVLLGRRRHQRQPQEPLVNLWPRTLGLRSVVAGLSVKTNQRVPLEPLRVSIYVSYRKGQILTQFWMGSEWPGGYLRWCRPSHDRDF